MGAKLTKEQIDELKNRNCVELLCDGFKVKINRVIIKNRVRCLLDINNELNPDWILKPDEHIESKFFRPWISYRKKSKRSKKMQKVDIGMRRVDYASMGQALRYLNKVCDSVEIRSKEYEIKVDAVTQGHCEALVDEAMGDE